MPSAFPQDGAHLPLRSRRTTDRPLNPRPVDHACAHAVLTGAYGRPSEQGRYKIRTVRPVPYPIPADGPVGMLLTATRRHPWRAAHIHARVVGRRLRTADHPLFDRDSDYLDSDTVFGVKESLIRDFVRGEDGVLRCESDFVLRRAGAS